MSMDLTVLVKEKLTENTLNRLNEYLTKEGVFKGDFVYESSDDRINIDIIIDNKIEESEFWEEKDFKAVGFKPKAQVNLSSRQNQASHKFILLTALQIAKMINGVIYDHQVDVIYDANGIPYGHNRTDGMVEEYGSGMDLFLEATGITSDLLKKE